MDRKEVTALVLLDLSKAFDSIQMIYKKGNAKALLSLQNAFYEKLKAMI